MRTCVSANGPAGIEPGKSYTPATGVGLSGRSQHLRAAHDKWVFWDIHIFNIKDYYII